MPATTSRQKAPAHPLRHWLRFNPDAELSDLARQLPALRAALRLADKAAQAIDGEFIEEARRARNLDAFLNGYEAWIARHPGYAEILASRKAAEAAWGEAFDRFCRTPARTAAGAALQLRCITEEVGPEDMDNGWWPYVQAVLDGLERPAQPIWYQRPAG